MNATYSKLNDGAWGVKVQGVARQGDTVTVTKRNGETKTETVARVLWTGNGWNGGTVSLCSVVPTPKPAARRTPVRPPAGTPITIPGGKRQPFISTPMGGLLAPPKPAPVYMDESEEDEYYQGREHERPARPAVNGYGNPVVTAQDVARETGNEDAAEARDSYSEYFGS